MYHGSSLRAKAVVQVRQNCVWWSIHHFPDCLVYDTVLVLVHFLRRGLLYSNGTSSFALPSLNNESNKSMLGLVPMPMISNRALYSEIQYGIVENYY